MPTTDTPLKETPLHALHVALGARMVEFAGYAMPVQYPTGILTEHLHTRAAAGLFDVSHMGQVRLFGEGAAVALETLVPGDIQGLAPGRQRYTLFTNDGAGILDDLMVTNAGDHLFVVVNAACKDADLAHLQAGLAGKCRIEAAFDRALLALQGPQAAAVLQRHAPGIAGMAFMSGRAVAVDGVPCFVTRSGYTGEDGFEIAIPAEHASRVAQRLLAEPEVKPIGLGARDSLRLEAGLCLYGHDIDTTTTPIEAALAWVIGKRRRAEGGYPGHAVVADQLKNGTRRRRVGLVPEGRQPAREGTPLTDAAGAAVGTITSGGFGPSVGGPVAMGYVASTFAADGTVVRAVVRGQPRPATVTAMPFFPHRYHRP
ncbi:MAG: glycine cleavage system aminomethyltransferase GcvT [Alphaproteobacteria bacterium]|nr:glycine cleavage system aminomethyltransferase GcvT [Alphaproteobacteria bacterium]